MSHRMSNLSLEMLAKNWGMSSWPANMQLRPRFYSALFYFHYMLNICVIFINQYCLYCDFSSRITSQQISKVSFHPAGSSSEISIAVFRSYETGQRGWPSARRRTPQIFWCLGRSSGTNSSWVPCLNLYSVSGLQNNVKVWAADHFISSVLHFNLL